MVGFFIVSNLEGAEPSIDMIGPTLHERDKAQGKPIASWRLNGDPSVFRALFYHLGCALYYVHMNGATAPSR